MNEREEILNNVRRTYLDVPWFEERAKLFSEISQEGLKFVDFQIQLTNLEAGWLDLNIFIEGVQRATVKLSRAFNPLPRIKRWLEQVVDDTLPMAAMDIDEEGIHAIFCYEHLSLAQYGWTKYGDTFDADTCYDIGWFYIYETGTDKILCHALCKTKDFVNKFYMTFLCFAGFKGASRKHPIHFSVDWYYDNTSDYYDGECISTEELIKRMEADDNNNWTFYNEIKSPMVEWNATSKEPYRCCWIEFAKPSKVSELIHMWAEWGDALFWSVDGCCGNCHVIHTDSGDFDLSCIDGLQEWYEEFDFSDPCVEWPKEKQDKWDEKGWQLAMKIRELLPDNIDLCYYWLPNKYNIKGVAPLLRLVPNQRLWIAK